MQKYVLVKFLESMSEGEEFIANNNWPLHITLVANFAVPFDAQNLLMILTEQLKEQKAIPIIAGKDEFFGQHKDIQVTTMKMTPGLLSLHEALVALLKSHGAEFDEPKYMNKGYRAHATIQTGARLNENDNVLLDEVTIVDMFPDNDITKRRVLQTVKLQ